MNTLEMRFYAALKELAGLFNCTQKELREIYGRNKTSQRFKMAVGNIVNGLYCFQEHKRLYPESYKQEIRPRIRNTFKALRGFSIYR